MASTPERNPAARCGVRARLSDRRKFGRSFLFRLAREEFQLFDVDEMLNGAAVDDNPKGIAATNPRLVLPTLGEAMIQQSHNPNGVATKAN